MTASYNGPYAANTILHHFNTKPHPYNIMQHRPQRRRRYYPSGTVAVVKVALMID
jgi:hypothetical protein